MSIDDAIALFSSYSLEEQREFLTRLIHELTVLARDSYEVGKDGLTNPQRMRRINEVQHRISANLYALLHGGSYRFPDDVLMRIVLEHEDDKELERQLNNSFERLATNRLTIV
ncbi:MAG TPA: hypothetical protein VJS44_16400 [Pyrinomonadaceae bacterium]|nr:hypothetical protein [Pyrinomonadaceae bacterium]